MTKDEDDWLADFLEVAQSTAKQSQAAAEKDYATKLKLMKPRFDRASTADADQAMAGRLAASEALAGQKKYDAALDELDEAVLLAAGLLATASAAAAIVEEESPAPAEEAPAPAAEDETSASLDEVVMEEPAAAEAPAVPLDEAPAEDIGTNADAVVEAAAEDTAVPEESAAPADEAPAEDLSASLDEMLAAEAPVPEESAAPVEEAPAEEADASLDGALAEFASEEPPPAEAETEGAPVSDTDEDGKTS